MKYETKRLPTTPMPALAPEWQEGCVHEVSEQVQKRWVQFQAMKDGPTDIAPCECCGGPAKISAYGEVLMAWLGEEGPISKPIQIAGEVKCSRCQ